MGAETLRVLYAGLGQTGSIPADPENIIGVGVGMTVAINYGVVGLFMAAGVSTIDAVTKLVVNLIAGGFVSELVSFIGADVLNGGSGVPLLPTAMNVLKVLLQGALGPLLTQFVAFIASQLAEAELIDSIPVAGQIARGVAAAIGGIQLAETSIEVGISPAVYTFNLVLTHDLSINILPDPNNTQFPQVPAGYTLYYKVSYLFDNGTAHTQDAVDVPDPTVKSIPITFTNIPRGGQVNISIGFYARHINTPAGLNDWCAGKGTTGLVDNSVDQAPDLTIEEIKIPIQSTTRYIHTSKTTLDASGNHVWADDADGTHAPPYIPPPNGQQPGLGDFRSITVRQGTSQPPQAGYVGYAWKAFSSGVTDCNANAPGQLDQLANLNTDRGNSGANAQMGYTNGACGLQEGVRLTYNLLSHDADNFYLDSSSLHIRPVQLSNPPGFSNPKSGQSVGQLNFDTTRLLLHPAGHIVSINNANHKLEALKLPAAPMDDADAEKFFLARSYSGQGTRPGLMTSPVSAAISPDGVILILEDSSANNRIQAFDLGGNPVPFFTQQQAPYFLTLAATEGATYLDLAVEFTGYLYVLSKDASNNHRLDIYHPNQAGTTPICTTMGVNAAKLTVDFWRSVYTLNYEVLQVPGGAIPAVTEPSVSLWVPPPPTV